jgi:hypothetical protein
MEFLLLVCIVLLWTIVSRVQNCFVQIEKVVRIMEHQHELAREHRQNVEMDLEKLRADVELIREVGDEYYKTHLK